MAGHTILVTGCGNYYIKYKYNSKNKAGINIKKIFRGKKT